MRWGIERLSLFTGRPGASHNLDAGYSQRAASQAKLLRVLQESEIHRVGGERVIRIPVPRERPREIGDGVLRPRFSGDPLPAFRPVIIEWRAAPMSKRLVEP